MTKIALIGPGAIGGAVAVRLMQTPRSIVTVCARTPITSLTLEDAAGTVTMSPEVLLSPDQGHPVDWILVATKAYDAAGAAAWFPGLMGPGTRVAVLQNGVEHVERFAPYVEVSRIVPVIVTMPVERIGPGLFKQRRKGHLAVASGANGRPSLNSFGIAGLTFLSLPIS